MSPKPQIFIRNSKEVTAKDLAKERGCSTEHMQLLLRKYGYPEAMNRKIRKAGAGRPPKQGKPASQVNVLAFDPDRELKRRMIGWMRQGMSVDEMMIKARAI